MKKIIVIVGIALLFIAGAIAAVFTISRNSINTAASPSASTSADAKTVGACDVLTQSVAEALLGSNITKNTAADASAQTTDLNVSSCIYMTKPSTTDANSGLPKLDGVSLMLYTAKTPAGADKNKETFNNKPAGVEAVEKIGDQAFYNPQYKQLHVLKNSNWYVVTYFKDDIANGSLDTDKTLAQKLKFQ